MKSKLKFFSVIVIFILMMCVTPLSFAVKEIFINKTLNLQYTDGMLYWSKITGSNVYYEIDIWLANLEYSDEHYTSQSVNIKEIFDSKSKATGTYRAQVIARGDNNSIIASETINFSYTSSKDKLEAPTNLRWDGKIARWNASPNATNYRILLLSARGGSVVTYTTSSLEYDFSVTSGYGVYEGYYFTVVAMADGYRESNANESPKYDGTLSQEPTTSKTYTITVKMLDNDSNDENIGGEISLTSGAYNGQTMFKDREIVEDFNEGIPMTLVARPGTGYKFICWKKDNSILTTETIYQFESQAQDETYTAVFEKEIEAPTEEGYIIRVKIYDNDSKKENVGGKISVTSGKYTGQNFFRAEEYVDDFEEGKPMTLVARAEDGYKFVCWQKGTNNISTETMYQFIVTKSETYTALFAKESTVVEQPVTEEPENVTTYEVEFETNGGNEISIAKVKEGEKVTKPANPAKDGYTFDGWYVNSKLTKVFDFNTEIDGDITLYAKWTENKVEEPETPVEQEEKTWENASSWAEEFLYESNKLGIMPSIFDKEDLTKNITRKEFAHVAVKLYEKLTGNKAVAVANNPFTDTEDTEVLKAYNIGITSGTSTTTFTPDALITREQMARMIENALAKSGIDVAVDLESVEKFDDDDLMQSWSRNAIYFMSSNEIIKGMGNNLFGVLENATREQAMIISDKCAKEFSK